MMFPFGSRLLIGATVADGARGHDLRRHQRRLARHDRADLRGIRPRRAHGDQPVHPGRRRLGDGHRRPPTSPPPPTAPRAEPLAGIGALGAVLVVDRAGHLPGRVRVRHRRPARRHHRVDGQAWSERASGDDAFNSDIRQRFAHPAEFPLLAALAFGVIVYSFSRIMLFALQGGRPGRVRRDRRSRARRRVPRGVPPQPRQQGRRRGAADRCPRPGRRRRRRGARRRTGHAAARDDRGPRRRR